MYSKHKPVVEGDKMPSKRRKDKMTLKGFSLSLSKQGCSTATNQPTLHTTADKRHKERPQQSAKSYKKSFDKQSKLITDLMGV